MDSAERKELKCVKEQVLAVQRMQDYIEKNRTEDITLSELAGASLFSPWYSYRLFREYIGLTPTEYIRKYRLTQAARRLRTGKVKVIDAAYDAGFSNEDTFTRAFYREFGLNPGDYMKHPVPITFFIPYGAKYRELRKENIDVSNIQTVFVQIIRKPERLRVTPVSPVFILGAVDDVYRLLRSVARGADHTGCAFLACPPARLAAAFPRQLGAMQKIVSLFPLTQGITMMKNAFIGADTGSMLLPVCVMLGLTALCTALSIRFSAGNKQ